MRKIKEFFKRIDRDILIGIGLIVVGIILFLASGAVLTTLVRLIGVAIVVICALRIAILMRTYAKGALLLISLFNAGLVLILGAVMALIPGGALAIVFSIVGAYMLFHSGLRAYRLWKSPCRLRTPAWWGEALPTALALLLGLWLLLSPSGATRATEIIAGITLIVKALEMIAAALGRRKGGSSKKKNGPEDVEAEFVDKSDE